jgi:hypothetical protein
VISADFRPLTGAKRGGSQGRRENTHKIYIRTVINITLVMIKDTYFVTERNSRAQCEINWLQKDAA